MKQIKCKYEEIKKYLSKKTLLNTPDNNNKYYSNNFISYRINKQK